MSFLTRTSLKNRLIVGLATLAVAAFGIFSMGALKQELMPSMQVPMAFVSVQSPGLAPEEMADAVTEPVEQSLRAVPGVTRVASTTSTGSADITVEWPFEEGEEETLRAVRAAADAITPSLPTGSEVAVFSGGTDGMPAMYLSAGVEGDEADFDDALAQSVVPALQSVEGVQRVDLAGREEQRIAIDLRPADVERLRVDPAQIQQALELYGAAKPAGEAEGSSGTLSVTVGSPITTVDDIAALPVSGEDEVVRVSDFADVHLESAPVDAISRVNGKPALTLQVIPAQGANVVDISHGVNAELDRLAPGMGAEFVTLFDQAPYIEQSIHDLSVEGGLGLLFAVLVILAFLGSWRSTVIAAISIPLSLLITLIGLWWSGNTLNILTLGALTIAIGRVVDDSIVVIENISRRRREGPLTIAGVVASVRQVAGAVTASTLTTVAVFLPIVFVSGIAGQLFRPFAVTVSIALLASLVVALTIVPVLAFWFMRGRAVAQRDGGARDDVQAAAESDADTQPIRIVRNDATRSSGNDGQDELDELHTAPDRLQRALMPTLRATRRHPVLTLLASVLILVTTLGMSSLLRTDFLGSSGAETLQLTQVPPRAGEPGADAESADPASADPDSETGGAAAESIAAAEPVEQAVAKVPGVRDVMTTITLQGAEGRTTISYDLLLADGADAEAVSADVERAIGRIEDAGELKLSTMDSVSTGGSDIALQIRGSDPVAPREASDLLEERLGDADGVRSVASDLSGEQPVVRVKLDDTKAARLGFDPTTVARAVQDALEGQAVGRLMLEGREHDILLRTPGTARTAEKLAEITLPITQQQTATAQKQAGDALQEKAEAEAEEARLQADADLAEQMDEAAAQRSELLAQIGALNDQLAALQNAPITPVPPLTPKERAETERAEQLAALQGAIASAQSGIAGLDQQIAGLQEARAQAADAVAEQQAAEAEQRAATEVRGTAVTLSDIATVEEELTAPTVSRADGERQVTLSVTPRTGKLDAASRAIDEAIATVDLPAGVTFELGGASAEQDEAFAQLGAAMLAAIALVLLVMIAAFRSFRGPFVLLVSVPFAATGAILGLLLTNTPLGLPALIGLLMLIGIVVTNAIVLMDLINRLRASGASLDDAVENGTRLRLRPILMTAAATVFALVPMSLGLTGGGVFISKPLAIVVIGGLMSSTLLTLILVPVLYLLVERRHERKLAARADRRARRDEKRSARRATRDSDRAAQRALKRGGADGGPDPELVP